MSEFTISDMIDSANRSSPSDFQSTFNNVLLDKIAAAIEQKRLEVAQTYFSSDEDSEDIDTETDENETTDEDEDNNNEDTETDSGNEEERQA